MAGVSNWRLELIEAYPDLFRPRPGVPEAPQGAPECGPGWHDLLDKMCVRIRAAIQADSGTFWFIQIKEKYGTARIYWDGTLFPEASAKVEEAIALAKARSACTCEICGEPGRLYGGGWLTTRCAAHAEERQAVEIRSEFDNVHILRQVVGQEQRVNCRRYHRETDSFVDVESGSLGIEEG